MRRTGKLVHRATWGLVAGAAMTAAGAAMAGGLAVREQSAQFQGLSFAGSGAGGGLSSSYWNSAAISQAGSGLQSDSTFSLIIPNTSVTSASVPVPTPGASPVGESVDTGRLTALSAGYYAYRLNNALVAGVGVNAPFGAANEFDNPNWAGQAHGRSAKIFSLNVNPMVSYNVLPNLALAVGLQAQYAKITFKTNPTTAGLPSQSNQGFEVDDVGFGGTAGILWTPVTGTTIGIGYRSAISHSFEGDLFKVGDSIAPFGAPFQGVGVKADITLPETVNLSLRQELTNRARLLASVEWTNWSRLQTVDFVATSTGGAPAIGAPIVPGQKVAVFDFHWNDGYMFSLGGEYDYSPSLTLRAGMAYEISPIRTPEQRLTLVTDSDRVWLSAGFNYKLTKDTSIDVGYSHVFFDDAAINRARNTAPTGLAVPFAGIVDQSADILAVGLKTKW